MLSRIQVRSMYHKYAFGHLPARPSTTITSYIHYLPPFKLGTTITRTCDFLGLGGGGVVKDHVMTDKLIGSFFLFPLEKPGIA